MKKPQGNWTDLFRVFRMALDPRKLWLAFRGIVTSLVLVGLLLAMLASIFHAQGVRFATQEATAAASEARMLQARAYAAANKGTGAPEPVVLDTDVWGAVRKGRLGDAVRATGTFTALLFTSALGDGVEALAGEKPRRGSPVYAFLNSEALTGASLALVLIFLVMLLVWSYYGTAIMRVAAVEYALGERIEVRSATAYAWRKHHSVYGAPLGLLAAMCLLAVGVLVGGLIGWNILVIGVGLFGVLAAAVVAGVVQDKARSLAAGLGAGALMMVLTVLVCVWLIDHDWRIPYVGEVVLGVLSPLAFVAGLLMIVMGVWLVFGAVLMVGALCSSDGDAFDAWSRSFHYLFTHPWHYVWYAGVACAHGAACLAFVYVVRVAAEWATLWPLATGMLGKFEVVYHYMVGGPTLGPSSGGERVLAFFLMADRLLLDLVFLSFVVAYSATAKTVLYFLMRRASDGTPISEVHLEPRDRELLYPTAAETEA